jgi:ssDNA-specific exonuclease RecJ
MQKKMHKKGVYSSHIHGFKKKLVTILENLFTFAKKEMRNFFKKVLKFPKKSKWLFYVFTFL